MSDKEHKEGQPIERATGETGPPKVQALGPFLKSEREKKGLSIQQVAEITRLRRHIIDALEKEAWDSLPPPVFVRGFIRSYAKALGLDEKEVLALYEYLIPTESEIPKPLLEPPQTGKSRLVYLILAILVLVGISFSIWKAYSPKEELPISPQEESLSESMNAEQPPAATQKPPEPLVEEAQPPEEVVVSSPETEVVTAETEVDRKLEEAVALLKEEQAGYDEEEASIDAISGPAESADWLVLKGIVEGRTWISISIDGNAPKEYIFQPGSRPQWKARKGFEIIVGNAAGIAFDFDGQRLENLGKLGQVVRLKLPEGYQGTDRED
ncbi:MAG: DUF4115 domain-containing protein [Desulfobacteraceae bacterium]|jgi:cytoskeleton protein RodZ